MLQSYFVIFLVISACYIIFHYFITPKVSEQFDINHAIPNKIWTFWDGDIPELVDKCIGTWKKYNPTYEIIILNTSSLDKYLPEIDFINMNNMDSITRVADMIRLHILAKYGGIWCDASVICLQPFDWINALSKKEGTDFVGFYIDSFTNPELLETSPVIENWFFACKQDCEFVKRWRDEFFKLTQHDNVDAYLDSLKSEGIDFEKLSSPNYLTMHASAQKVLQKNTDEKFKLSLLKAEDTAFKYLTQNNWDSKASVINIVDCYANNQAENCDFMNGYIIKLRGIERIELESLDIPLDFFERI